MSGFAGFFAAATGRQPDRCQAEIAASGFPDVVSGPPGDGGLVLAWLWRRLYRAQAARVPRRLLYVLPPGSLTEPLTARLRAWLANLGLAGTVALHVPRGGAADGWGDWREEPHQPAILLGQADLLVSKALNRGYGAGYPLLPIDFALTVNGSQWLVDQPARSPRAADTLRRLAVLAAELGTAEPFAVTFLTADPSAISTSQVATVAPGDDQALASLVRERHRPGTRTLVALGQAVAAQRAGRLLREQRVRCVLRHDRFRGTERAAQLAQLTNAPADLVVVSAGEAAYGLGLDAALVVTEAGRPAPAERAPERPTPLTRQNLLALFDTAPAGLGWSGSGSASDQDAGAERYLRDAGEPAVEVAWVTWTAGVNGEPDPGVRYPAPEHRCRVGVSDARALAASRPAWWFDRTAGEWGRVAPQTPLAPYDLVLVDAADGGYDPQAGFDLAAPGPVPGCPALLTLAELAELAELAGPEAPDAAVPGAAVPGAALPGGGPAARPWQSLDRHSEEVRNQAAALLAVLAPAVPAEAARAAVVAAYLHDAGKAHPVWQDALCALADEADAAWVQAGRPWAKSGTNGRLEFAGGVAFRHELASLLLIDGPLRPLLADSPDPDLTRYLVLAHHGLLRVQVRDPRPAGPFGPGPERELLGLRDGAVTPVPPLLGQPASALTVDLDPFFPGGLRSWTATVGVLLDRYGPFVLSYLEAIVRIADWRASGGRSLPEPHR